MEIAGAFRSRSGQATLEHMGLTLLVALLFAALGTWMLRGGWPSAATGRPPAIIEHLAAPLMGATAGTGGPAVGSIWSRPGEVGAGEGRTAIPGGRRAMEQAPGRAVPPGDGPGVLRRAWNGLLWWGLLNVDGQIEAGKGFLEQIGVRADGLVTDPVTTVGGAVDRLAKPPVTSTAGRVASIVGVLATIDERPFRESFLRVSRDLGGLGADWLITKFARGAGDALGRVLPG